MAFLLIQLLTDSGKTPLIAAWIGLGFGLVNWLAGLPSYWLEDWVGRSVLMMIGLPNLAWLMLILAFCFKLSPDSSARNPLTGIFIVIFTA